MSTLIGPMFPYGIQSSLLSAQQVYVFSSVGDMPSGRSGDDGHQTADNGSTTAGGSSVTSRQMRKVVSDCPAMVPKCPPADGHCPHLAFLKFSEAHK
uniref:Uncharacterized protein n=1 Tax=Globodera rostochiensis TaxID=31243 RepID=A0A914I6B0_GLORO